MLEVFELALNLLIVTITKKEKSTIPGGHRKSVILICLFFSTETEIL
jgi:hypothetical protein